MKAKQALAAVIISTLIGCAPAVKGIMDRSLISEKQIVVTDLTGMVYKLTKEEGLSQLRALAIESKYEDIWYFIPETKEWLDYGKEISRDGCYPENDLLLALNPKPKEVISYHIHPAENLKYKASKHEFKDFQGALPPSVEDLEHWLQVEEQFQASGTTLTECGVVDLGGYWSLDLKTSDIDKMKSSLRKYSLLAHDYMINYSSMRYKNKDDKNALETARKQFIKEFETESAKLGLNLKYSLLQ